MRDVPSVSAKQAFRAQLSVSAKQVFRAQPSVSVKQVIRAQPSVLQNRCFARSCPFCKKPQHGTFLQAGE
jgi:hypothetical protein